MKKMLIYSMLIYYSLATFLLIIMNMKNWISMWISMEMMTFMMMTLIVKLSGNSQLTIKIMIINLISTMLILIMILNTNNLMVMKMLSSILLSMILWFKIGLFPFTLWYMFICKMNSWLLFFFVSTLIKFPIMLMLSFSINSVMFKMMMFVMLIPLISFYFINMKKILLILSTNNILWMIFSMLMNLKLWMLMVMTYNTINWMLFNLLKKFKMNFTTQTNLVNNNTKLVLILLMMNLMSLPPMPMFMFKWILISTIFINKMISMMLMTNNIFSFFVYMKMMMNYLNPSNTQFKWMKVCNMKMENLNFMLLLVMLTFFMV